MDIANYGSRINSVSDIEKFGKVKNEYLKQHRFSVKNNSMLQEEVKKSKFAQINDKRNYFEDGIVPLPFSHPSVLDIVNYKTVKKQKVEKYIQPEKNYLLRMEKEALLKSHRLSTLQSIHLQWPEIRNLSSNERSLSSDIEKINFSLTTRSFLLNGFLR